MYQAQAMVDLLVGFRWAVVVIGPDGVDSMSFIDPILHQELSLKMKTKFVGCDEKSVPQICRKLLVVEYVQLFFECL